MPQQKDDDARDRVQTRARVTVIGAGLAGAEAAWQAALFGARVRLFEMRPVTMTPAHKTGLFAELVCSNSLRSDSLVNGVGLLKEEMRRLGSLVMTEADRARVPAGSALAVDRHRFAQAVTERVEAHPNIEVVRGEVTQVPLDRAPAEPSLDAKPSSESEAVVIATGPLTSPALASRIAELTGEEYFYFFDAAAPIVTGESVRKELAFWAGRYGRGDTGEGDYLNCPLTREEYERFWRELIDAEAVSTEHVDKMAFFEGCLPVEEMARRGVDTLRFGPMKPVGLANPATGEQPYAVLQLRREDQEGRLFNLVGFQTRLRFGEQERVFRLVPALAEAEFVRFGLMHRNSFMNAPVLLLPSYQWRGSPRVFFAGQMTGVEGYVESAASGLLAGLNAARVASGLVPLVFPGTTMIGAMAHYITSARPDGFQPMNANFGLLPPLPERRRRRRERKEALAERALADLASFTKIAN